MCCYSRIEAFHDVKRATNDEKMHKRLVIEMTFYLISLK